jgi:hypothetical protein
MDYFVRWLHLLALALWLGGGVFFSFFTALPIIRHMETLAQTPDNWAGFTSRSQGTRIAGEALSAVFANYFPYQAVCGVIALGTAAVWLRRPGTRPRLRVLLLATALLLVVVNLVYLSPWVHELRQQRYATDAAVAELAEAAFGEVHQLSLLADMATLALVFITLTMSATEDRIEPAKPS